MVVMTLQRPVKVMDGDPCEANCLCGKFIGGWLHLRGVPDETTGILARRPADTIHRGKHLRAQTEQKAAGNGSGGT